MAESEIREPGGLVPISPADGRELLGGDDLVLTQLFHKCQELLSNPIRQVDRIGEEMIAYARSKDAVFCVRIHRDFRPEIPHDTLIVRRLDCPAVAEEVINCEEYDELSVDYYRITKEAYIDGGKMDYHQPYSFPFNPKVAGLDGDKRVALVLKLLESEADEMLTSEVFELMKARYSPEMLGSLSFDGEEMRFEF